MWTKKQKTTAPNNSSSSKPYILYALVVVILAVLVDVGLNIDPNQNAQSVNQVGKTEEPTGLKVGPLGDIKVDTPAVPTATPTASSKAGQNTATPKAPTTTPKATTNEVKKMSPEDQAQFDDAQRKIDEYKAELARLAMEQAERTRCGNLHDRYYYSEYRNTYDTLFATEQREQKEYMQAINNGIPYDNDYWFDLIDKAQTTQNDGIKAAKAAYNQAMDSAGCLGSELPKWPAL